MSALDEKKHKAGVPGEDAESHIQPAKNGDVDYDDPTVNGPGLHRQLKNRHIAMISIGGVIGTGLFLGTATALQNGGPIGLLLGYCTVGTIVYAVMISLGEMVAYLPIAGGHIKLAERFVDPAWSFAMGYNYLYNWVIILPAELSAAAVLISYWTDINGAAWIALLMVFIFALNLLGAKAYGESEFWFCSIKVLTIVGLIILGIILDLGGGPSHDRIGFRYWISPGPFNQYNKISGAEGRFLGYWAVITQAAFGFIGTEIVAIAAGEARNPRRNLPRAIKRVYIRILLFYIGGVTIIGLLVPFTEPRLALGTSTAAASPFVIAIQRAGIKGLPGLINACLLTSATSAASSDLYTSSRALYGLALAGNAPSVFKKTSKNGLPWVSILFCASFSLLAFMGVSSGSGKVFGWFVNLTAVAGLMTWFAISVTYIRFHKGFKVQGYDRSKLPFASKLQPFAAYYSATACIVICVFSGWNVFLKDKWATDIFITNYIPLIIFPILYICARFFYFKTGWVAPENMDFTTGLEEIEAASYDEPPPRNKVEAVWQWLM